MFTVSILLAVTIYREIEIIHFLPYKVSDI